MPSQDTIDEIEDTKAEPAKEEGPTAKQMAAAEEANAARIQARMRQEHEQAMEASKEPVSIIGLAAQGREVLLEQLRQHAERNKPKEYIPPPRTARQMEQLEAELEAGRKSQARAQAQQASRPVEKTDMGKEGFTTPVYRPDNMVPDPMTGRMGAITEK